MADTVSHGILSFAQQLATGGGEHCALSLARSRRWLDEQGRATREGRMLFDALIDQRHTRTALRFVV